MASAMSTYTAERSEARGRESEDWSGRVRGPRGLGHLWALYRIAKNYADADLDFYRRYGDVVRIELPRPGTLFVRPRHAEQVLRTQVRRYVKGHEYELLKPLLGDGIFVSEGDLWTRQRRLLAPEFREATVARFAPPITASAEQLFAEWDALAPGATVDFTRDMMRLTLWVVGRTMFHSQFLEEAERIGHNLEVCLAHALTQMLSMGLYPSWLPTRANREAKRAERDLDDAMRKILQHGRASEPGAYDVLSRMIVAKDPETGATMTDRQLRDEVKSLVLAGHETTSLALSWGFYLLAQHPEHEARLAEEASRVLGSRPPTAADLPRLEYARKVFLETLRLYPPVPSVTRRVVEAHEIDGIPLAVDDNVILSPYVTQRHPEYWTAPSRFDPERFEPSRLDRLEPYSYMPFLLGRRACLGEHFAMLEGTLLFAMIAQRYRVRRLSDEPLPTRPISTLRFAKPLLVRLERRG